MEVLVRAAAVRFRAALEQGGLSHVTFKRFPVGSCGDASELLGEYLSDCGLGEWTYRFGMRGAASHGWIEQDGVIVDVTGDQFGDGQPAVVVARASAWHDGFVRAGGGRRAGLAYYSPDVPGDALRADYSVLRRRADALL